MPAGSAVECCVSGYTSKICARVPAVDVPAPLQHDASGPRPASQPSGSVVMHSLAGVLSYFDSRRGAMLRWW